MKRFEYIFKTAWLFFLCLLTNPIVTKAQVDSLTLARMDSVEISLVTCGPGQLPYELYGHTALRIKGQPFTFYTRNGEEIIFDDITANWGLFSFNQPHFIPRFVFGKTDYRMGIAPTEEFLEEYTEERRWVKQQSLNLQPEEKANIIEAIKTNALPENRTYRYNYLYDNCTTRADQIIIRHIEGALHPPIGETPFAATYREAIHQYNEHHRWARMGNDLLLGWQADRAITLEQRPFLPIDLMRHYDQTTICRQDSATNLVSSSQVLCQAIDANTPTIFPPIAIATVLLLFTLFTMVIELRRQKRCYIFDALLLLLSGVGGLILTAMIFSEHPTVQQNLQILLLNPLSTLCLYPAIRNERKGRSHWYWKVYAICILLFFLGNLIQRYAEGMNVLALCLLLRCYMNIKKK